MLVWFTDVRGCQIAIDSRQVVSVRDAVSEKTGIVIVETVNDSFEIEESILDVVARLNAA